MKKINIAIFVSGGGTNCENLIKYFSGSESVNCALVVSNKADAYALVRAERLGVPTAVATKPELNDETVMMPYRAAKTKTELSNLSMTPCFAFYKS